MLAQVTIDDDGVVSCMVDTDQDDGELSALTLDNALAQASQVALDTWLCIHGTDAEPETATTGTAE